ncbi:DUF4351 domain-containing protein [Modicisalibacter tunisiensis]|uniref:DUF4351 domain-containing protein n=1 Tax=Modicisalibacter tunisiensis TaxID=390637 RepID=UPI00079A5E0C|nr:DUF4351 domain-containing protein [Modicisalibacter tunisiensis]KXS36839.1 MAG: hypothetical protein AWU55_2850 [Halomonadaceae bacterium T82-2]
MSRTRELSADEETRRLAFVRERALRDEVSLLNDAKREGEMTGERRVLQRLLSRRFGELPGWIGEMLEAADTKRLEAWTDEILTVDTLDELFKH